MTIWFLEYDNHAGTNRHLDFALRKLFFNNRYLFLANSIHFLLTDEIHIILYISIKIKGELIFFWGGGGEEHAEIKG